MACKAQGRQRSQRAGEREVEGIEAQIEQRRIESVEISFELKFYSIWYRIMRAQAWHKVAAISGMAAMGLGTYGAHIHKPAKPAYKDVWQTANMYHLVHSAALLAAPVTRHPNVFGGLLTFGIVTFCGPCYLVAYAEDRKYGALAPFGGSAFLAAWASLLF